MSRPIEITKEAGFLWKLSHINWGLVVLICAVAVIGFMALYSAAGGHLDRWAMTQMQRFILGIFGMFVVAMIDTRIWYRLSYPIYAFGILLLILVELIGHVGMGAQRWIDIGFMKLQPSELMKIAVVMALARYFHGASGDDMKRIFFLIPAVIIIILPVALVMLQPDLGTSIMIVMVGIALLFLAGAPKWMFAAGFIATIAALPLAWKFMMHDYQKQRVRTLLNPESDPLGAGYHITQSKIALGSGGLEGKGFMNGSQSRLNFLPEKQTDFIFTLWAEEWGFLGGILLLGLYTAIFIYCALIALRSRQSYGRLMSFGLMINFSLYVFINMAMVMGLIPVVGVPLPLISYGGTSMLAVLIAFGLIMSTHIHKESKLPRGNG